MNILLTNDDGINAKGLGTLIEILQPYGNLTVVAPKGPQSGMSMSVSLGFDPIGVRKVSGSPRLQRWYVDASPASCVKFGLDNILYPCGIKPDVVVSGINHGSNAATASIYSGTIGAVMEAAVNGIKGIGVSLDSFDPDADFSAVRALFPDIFEEILAHYPEGYGNYVNVNFPDLPATQIAGSRICRMGHVHWEREYMPYSEFLSKSGRMPKPGDAAYIRAARAAGEELYVMCGDFVDNGDNDTADSPAECGEPAGDPRRVFPADHVLLSRGYVTIMPQNIDNSCPAVLDAPTLNTPE